MQGNKIFFEKLICKYQRGSKIGQYKCLVKYIDRNNVKMDVWGNLTEPVSSIRISTQFFYKYNTYQQAGGTLNIDICDLIKNGKRSVVNEFVFAKLSKFSNINHKCPYVGLIYGKSDNVSIDEFAYPQLMPSGRYRVDSSVFEDNNRILFNFSFYFSISDHRLDVKLLKL